MQTEEKVTICPQNIKEWRLWLQKNHKVVSSVWVIYYKKAAARPTIVWSDAVDEALCFGWIDSTRRSVDADRFIQLFTQRKAKSTWSKINKEKTERLIAEGRMAKAGIESIAKAKENGSWNILDDVEALKMPADLEKAFKLHKGSKQFFSGLSKSVKKTMLHWITFAKRPETRQKRIDTIVQHAALSRKPAGKPAGF